MSWIAIASDRSSASCSPMSLTPLASKSASCFVMPVSPGASAGVGAAAYHRSTGANRIPPGGAAPANPPTSPGRAAVAGTAHGGAQ